jgi:hypothetical protein
MLVRVPLNGEDNVNLVCVPLFEKLISIFAIVCGDWPEQWNGKNIPNMSIKKIILLN